MPPAARSLADDLRARDDEALTTLLLRRPDLARPAPTDITTLAARATTRSSVQRALDGLDLATLRALEAVVAAGPVRPPEVARLLGEPPRSARVARLLEELWTLALVWHSPEGIRAARTVHEVMGDPAGLGPALADVPEGRALAVALAGLSPRERSVLDALAWGPPTGVLSTGSADRAVAEAGASLVAKGLLHRVDDQHVLLPRQVGLALRGGRLYREPRLDPPVPDAPALDLQMVDAAAGGRAGELLTEAAELIDEWGARPPRVLRSGGLAVRDLGRVATLLELTREQAAWLVEVLAAAGLVAADDRGEPAWMPTGAADDWLEEPAHVRWAQLAGAWLRMTAAPSLVGTGEGGRVNALSPESSWPPGRQRRLDALDALASLPPGTPADAESLAELVRWRRPIRTARAGETGVEVVLREAEWAGVTGRGALSTPGRLLLGGDEEAAAAAMADHIPPPVEEVLLQADLTAVAPGRLDGPARSLMRLVSDVESRGGATVHRFTEASIRRALDAGWTADRLLGELAQMSRTPVPQPLEYLVRDVARRHGALRVGVAGAYVRSDDSALLDRMLTDRELGLLQLRRIAPTVVVSPLPPGTVLDVLRDHQYGPVGESPDGAVALAPAHHHRTTRPGSTHPVRVQQVDRDIAHRVVVQMRTGEQARRRAGRGAHGAPPPTDPVVTAHVLREAAAEGHAVWVGYADDAGGVRRLLVRPQSVEAGRVRVTVEDQDAVRTLSLHRITGAHVAD